MPLCFFLVLMNDSEEDDFYVRYYVGHRGRFGHEFLEFEVRADGRVRYANSSQYKSDVMIRKEVYVGKIVVDEIKRIIETANITELSDADWPPPDREGRQEVEISVGGKNLMFVSSKIRSMNDVANSKDPQGLQKLYYLVQDFKCLVFSIINLHFRVKPV